MGDRSIEHLRTSVDNAFYLILVVAWSGGNDDTNLKEHRKQPVAIYSFSLFYFFLNNDNISTVVPCSVTFPKFILVLCQHFIYSCHVGRSSDLNCSFSYDRREWNW